MKASDIGLAPRIAAQDVAEKPATRDSAVNLADR
jgi:hypothetical protein